MKAHEAFLKLEHSKVRRSGWQDGCYIYQGPLGSVLIQYPPDQDYLNNERLFWRAKVKDLLANDWEVYE